MVLCHFVPISRIEAEYVWTTVAYVISQARGLSGLGVGRTAPFMAPFTSELGVRIEAGWCTVFSEES